MQQFIMVDTLDKSLYPDKFTLPNSQKLFVGGLSDLTTECKYQYLKKYNPRFFSGSMSDYFNNRFKMEDYTQKFAPRPECLESYSSQATEDRSLDGIY